MQWFGLGNPSAARLRFDPTLQSLSVHQVYDTVCSKRLEQRDFDSIIRISLSTIWIRWANSGIGIRLSSPLRASPPPNRR